MFAVSDVVYRFVDRDIILVTLEDGFRQPMYRSSGRSSGMPGAWLPFDGISHNGTWFNKARYCTPAVPVEFQRFGNQGLKDLSRDLGKMVIPTGAIGGWNAINAFLRFNPEETEDVGPIWAAKAIST